MITRKCAHARAHTRTHACNNDKQHHFNNNYNSLSVVDTVYIAVLQRFVHFNIIRSSLIWLQFNKLIVKCNAESQCEQWKTAVCEQWRKQTQNKGTQLLRSTLQFALDMRVFVTSDVSNKGEINSNAFDLYGDRGIGGGNGNAIIQCAHVSFY